ncbi:type I restriction enzyme S subunit [Pseudarthrobacter defluvii]|uniref:restriction endonuclease subunit S n=1 Tax=Pseudarthrobacter defluvii TaxID=410837 RepID=UPI00278352FC|nr:restriction endonuclease subunit S [Pseudarthrobacter defluvii]MDQ0771493.1 type I restriction enzyme S subunit [Pseudarthrobacter defluvii]
MNSTLGEVCSIIMGQAPSGDTYSATQGVPLIAGAGDFSRGVLSPKKYTSQPTKLSRAGDVVLSIRASIGDKVWSDGEYCLGRGVAALRAGAQLDRNFLWHWLGHIEPTLRAKAKGATFLQVNRSDITELPLPVPPLDEQRRIAAILDKADELRTKRRAALAHLDALTQSIFHAMFGDPVTNPRNLPRLALPEIGRLYSGGTPSKATPENWEGDVPWFSPKDIKESFLENSKDHISPQVTETTSLKLLPAKTVVFVVRGMILAHSFPVAMLRRPATINQDLKAIQPYKPIEPEFLLACLQAQHGHAVSLVETAAHGTKKLTADGLSKIYVFEVSLERQQEFAGQVSAVERLKQAHRKHLAELDALFASLQHRAFKGEL